MSLLVLGWYPKVRCKKTTTVYKSRSESRHKIQKSMQVALSISVTDEATAVRKGTEFMQTLPLIMEKSNLDTGSHTPIMLNNMLEILFSLLFLQTVSVNCIHDSKESKWGLEQKSLPLSLIYHYMYFIYYHSQSSICVVWVLHATGLFSIFYSLHDSSKWVT